MTVRTAADIQARISNTIGPGFGSQPVDVARLLSDLAESISSVAGLDADSAASNFLQGLSEAKKADYLARTSLNDLTTDLNAWTAYLQSSGGRLGFMPAGKARADGTWWLLPEGTTFKGVNVSGAGRHASTGTLIDGSLNLTTPIVNIALGRSVDFGALRIRGPNVAPTLLTDLYYEAAWVTGGVADSRYKPQCGICIDGGVGSTPAGGGYSGFTYRGLASGSEFMRIDVAIEQCVVGIMHNCETTPAVQGDGIYIIDPEISYSKVPIAVGQSQANCITVVAGNLFHFRTGVDCLEYGQQTGRVPVMLGTQYFQGFECWCSSNQQYPMVHIGGKAETVHRLGQAGIGNANTAYPTILEGFLWDGLVVAALPSGRAPALYESASSPLFWTGSMYEALAPAYQIIAEPTVFQGWVRIANRFRPFVGCTPNINSPLVMKNARVVDATNAVLYGEESRRLAISGRFSAHISTGAKRVAQTLYEYVPYSGDNVSSALGVISNWVYGATIVTFDTTQPELFMANDLVDATFVPIGKSVTQQQGPGYRVDSVASNTVTCTRLYRQGYYVEDGTRTTVRIFLHEWAPGQALTGDTHTNTTLDNVSPTTILQNGDWIKAASGLPANCRVLSGGGTATITLNKAATDSASGKTVYGGRLNAVTTSAAF